MQEDGKFIDFGFSAEERYTSDIQEGDTRKSLFRHFKMLLHSDEVCHLLKALQQSAFFSTIFQTVALSTTIKATNGKVRSAIDVFSFALQYLKDHFLTCVENSKSKYDLSITTQQHIYLL